jgi:1-aminocyclopropane-1-carboxylate deaminase/D-cysteine desulfhydrase-like pyridoxal-dependent ACC family enzyme
MQNKTSPLASGIAVHCAHDALVSSDELARLFHPKNPNQHPQSQIELLAKVVKAQGWRNFVTVSLRSGLVIAGHGRVLAALELGGVDVPVNYQNFATEEDELQHLLADNRLAELSEKNLKSLADVLQGLADRPGFDFLLTGFTKTDLSALVSKPVADASVAAKKKLAERFGVAPFSVLDARRGEWQERKRAWLGLGIRSEVGRGGNLLKMSETVLSGGKPDRGQTPNMGGKADNPEAPIPGYYDKLNSGMTREQIIAEFKAKNASLGKTYGTTDWIKQHGLSGGAQNLPGTQEEWTGTSIFDPVLTEILYRWFCPPGGRIFDPFAGGSVRGIVAGWHGYHYNGIDLREEQVVANRAQADKILAAAKIVAVEKHIEDPSVLTPVQRRGSFWFKRDDLFWFRGVKDANGGKVRTMLLLAQGATGLVACGDRISTQIPRAATVAKMLGLPVRIHTASGEFTDGMATAAALGADIVQHDPGYLNVVKARAREDAQALGYKEVPWAVECQECIEATAPQAANLPPDASRIVVVVGSGMSLAGVLNGMEKASITTPVLGVMVGGSRDKVEARLDTYAPVGWRDRVSLVESASDFHSPAPATELEGVQLDPFYEAKVIPFVQPGDCVWCVGIRASEPERTVALPQWATGDSVDCQSLAPGEYDLVFSCPPYADLEVYSDDPRDLSAKAKESYGLFLESYRAIIRNSCAMLKPGRFACFIVGDVRDKDGNYLNFVSDTIAAFRDAGLHFYNEIILVTSCGSLAIRVGKQFSGYRKVGKTHQNVLVFLKGKCSEVKGWPVPDFSLSDSDFEAQPEPEAAK